MEKDADAVRIMAEKPEPPNVKDLFHPNSDERGEIEMEAHMSGDSQGRGLASMAAIQPPQQERVIDPFPNEGGEGWLRNQGRAGALVYTGETEDGKAEGRGSIRSKGGEFTFRGAAFRGGAMLPCRAVFALDGNGDAFAGPLAACGLPPGSARGAVVRGEDGGRFEGTWPARGADYGWFRPLRGAAWVRDDGSVHAVALDQETAIFRIDSGGDGWRPGGAGWVRVGVLKGRAGQVRAPPPPPAPCARAHARPRN
jgi:hypothetical protein